VRSARRLARRARDVDPFGRARVLVPSMPIAAVAARLTHHRARCDAVIRIGLGYYAADGVASLLEPIAGRHRPR